MRIINQNAIDYAEKHGLRLSKYADPIDGDRDDLTPDEALEIIRQDGEVWIDLDDFTTDHLDGEALRIASVITEVVTEWAGRPADGGGCRAFYTPSQWMTEGTIVHGCTLIVCHDGGDLSVYAGGTATACRLRDRINRRLYAMGASCGHCGAMDAHPGYLLEEISHWYSAVYAIGGES